MEIFHCPKCKEECFRHEVDIGLNEPMLGPWGCYQCRWSEWPEYDLSEGQSPVREGGTIDQFGMLKPIPSLLMDKLKARYQAMQTPEAAAAMQALFDATPEELGETAVRNARFEAVKYTLPPGMTLQQFARDELAKIRETIPDNTPRESKIRTAYAVICPVHGQLYLSRDEYNRQMCSPDNRWTCPRCPREADWDDNNFESFEFFDEVD